MPMQAPANAAPARKLISTREHLLFPSDASEVVQRVGIHGAGSFDVYANLAASLLAGKVAVRPVR